MCSVQSLLLQVKQWLREFSEPQHNVIDVREKISQDDPGPYPSIAILGAGIGGLALAIGLIKRGIPVKIYEGAKEYATVGAGIGFGPNSLSAIDLLDSRFRARYEAAMTANERPEFEHSVFDALYAEDGFGEKRGWTRGLIGAPYFTRSSAHRKELLQIMESLIPDGTVQFSKRAEEIKQSNGKVTVRFSDGQSITVDALIACDGVKGMARETVLGDISPQSVAPTYCNMYIFRGILPMEDAKNILGKHAGDAKWFMAKGKGVAIYPISKGTAENFVFFVSDDSGWEESKAQFRVRRRRCWLIWWASTIVCGDYGLGTATEMANIPSSEYATYVNDRVCLLGDVAHASSPHQAAGAGQGLEDAVVLSHLLSLVKTADELNVAFNVYDKIRRPRAQKVVTTSHEAGEVYTWVHPEIGDDMEKIVENGNQRLDWIWQHDLVADNKTAETMFFAALAHR